LDYQFPIKIPKINKKKKMMKNYFKKKKLKNI
jgi:hypothetical protein